MIGSFVALAYVAAAGPVVLRAGEAPPSGEVSSVSIEGVVVEPPKSERDLGEAIIIGWDRVRRVEGDLADQAEQFATIADQAWRARTRLERGDYPSAERLLEGLFETYEGRVGPTAAVVAEGLLRARLRRGAQTRAVRPWLALLDSRNGPGTRWLDRDWSREANLPPVLDAATGLAPSLPPIWLAGQAVGSRAASVDGVADEPGESSPLSGADALDALYRFAARFENSPGGTMPVIDRSDAGVALVGDVVAARTGDPDSRAAAREALRERLTGEAPDWLVAWCRVGIGRSLLKEPGPDDRRLGVIELLRVPARLAVSQPYLAGVALAEAAVAMRELGDTRGAGVLHAELMDGYAGHPALNWDPIRNWPNKLPSDPPGQARTGRPMRNGA